MNNQSFGPNGSVYPPFNQPPQGYTQPQIYNSSPQQGYTAGTNPQDYFLPPEPAMYAPPQQRQYSYTPSPEEILVRQKHNEEHIVRKLGNRAGWAAFTVHMAMYIIVIFLTIALLPSQDSPQYENIASLVNSIGAMIAMFISGFMLLGLTHTKLKNVMTFKRTKSLKRCTAAFFVGLGAIPVCNLLAQLVANNLSLIGIENKSYETSGFSTEIDLFYIVVQILCTAIVPAISEEFFFRGALLGSLKPYGQGFAIVMSSVIFGLIHGNLGQIPFAIAGGMFFAFLTIYTGSLIPSMILHCINNLLSVVQSILVQVVDENIVYAVMIAYYVLFSILAIVAFAMLSKRDKDFMHFERPESKISDSQKSLAFISSPGMIVFIVIMALETVFAYYSFG
ncbi:MULTISPECIES: type II CAAX prenyl endopeptidase Rce1 family protein [unclassified Ruminococcus]|uniref:CPBP family glutamic-type intramembrane protease n=1 Tax=unclassified Ruminococcus TaxID=2608920 RepID=UPI00210BC44C|nr:MULTISPECIES: CPBP family glutamic-type intramembrane protease [unclassified Ruminococcus]MCQ4022252.1 CPBP family intramembrane metalloprotease [Ruminococcus sp. zg-924]MCQ4114580.1 CPBP family intramembrane metalloprotease [Ruminococcus sp. zg-921]